MAYEEGYDKGFKDGIMKDEYKGKKFPESEDKELTARDSTLSEKRVGCGKVFETDLGHKNGTKDKLVCRCGGGDGLCDGCSKSEETAGVKDE